MSSDTPRTNADEIDLDECIRVGIAPDGRRFYVKNYVTAELSRAIERELTGAQATIAAQAQRIVDLEKEIAAYKADAERYRWLRSEHNRYDPICHLSWKRNGNRNGSEWVNTAILDAAIDAALKEHPHG